MIPQFIIFFMSACVTSAAVLFSNTSVERFDKRETYPQKPNEVLPIQPILIYSSTKETPHQARALFKDNKIIYIKLLKQKSYRPKKFQSEINEKHEKMRDIFYVKAFANGQFSHNRLKMYRLPEFYAISVYRKDQLKE